MKENIEEKQFYSCTPYELADMKQVDLGVNFAMNLLQEVIRHIDLVIPKDTVEKLATKAVVYQRKEELLQLKEAIRCKKDLNVRQAALVAQLTGDIMGGED